MGTAAVAALSALAGVLITALFDRARERESRRTAMATRWDEIRFEALLRYLTAANGAHRRLLYANVAMALQEDGAEAQRLAAIAEAEELHMLSEPVTLLTGERSDPIREAARNMRQSLEPLRLALLQQRTLGAPELDEVTHGFRTEREAFIRAAQGRLDVVNGHR